MFYDFTMCTRTLLNPILNDDHVTRGLEDDEARLLIEWLVEQVETKFRDEALSHDALRQVRRLCHRARAIARFVALWCHEQAFGPALQLAATERFAWPLPIEAMDAWDLLSDILAWESGR